ncbi:hypothetical protein ABZT17_13580 [Streptomyces sp. NPDC005648]
MLAVLVTVAFAPATLIGLWALNRTPEHQGVIFSGPGPSLTRRTT